MPRVTYEIYALRVCCSRPISGLLNRLAGSEVDVEVRLDGERSWPNAFVRGARQLRYTSPFQNECGDPILRVWIVGDGALFHFRYADGTQFIVDRAGTRVWAAWPAELNLENTSSYLLGPILGLVLRLRGITCLHASAIDLGGEAIAIVGPPGAGKSTAAATLAKNGYGVLSDDVVALADHGTSFLVQPAYPRLGLWPESVEALFGLPDALPRQIPTWDKRYLDLTQNGYEFRASPVQLRAVYFLGAREADARAPFVAALAGQTGLRQLIENTYVSYLLDKTMSAQDLDVLARLASVVPLRQVVPHADIVHLEKLQQVILEDFRELTKR